MHAHSSFAGGYARIALLGAPPRIVYTAHCFAMERRDISRAARFGYRVIEKVLARNTDSFAGCSQREVELSRQLAPAKSHTFVVNVADVGTVDLPAARAEGHRRTAPVVAASGRLCPQRDPAFFIEVVRLMRSEETLEALWIGGGNDRLVGELHAAGIEVTGWLPRSGALSGLAEADLYVHCAAWDGAPMTMLEAQALSVPMVARRTPALVDAPSDEVGSTPGEVAARALAALRTLDSLDSNRSAWSAYFAANTVENQRRALLIAYGDPTQGGGTGAKVRG